MKKLLYLGLMLFSLIGGGIVLAGTACLGTGANCSTTTTVQITLTGGDICIGSSGAFNFGTFTALSTSQTVTGARAGSDYFYVDDLKGANSGYYTTVQMSGNLVGTGGEVISGSNVYMQTNTTPVLISGRTNARVYIHSGMGSFQALNTARQLINRDAANNQGLISKYGTLPQMQVIVPAYQGVGNYQGTLVYTLYSN